MREWQQTALQIGVSNTTSSTMLSHGKTLADLIRLNGFFSNDVKQKVLGKQFLIDGEPMGMDDIKMELHTCEEAGEFVWNNRQVFTETFPEAFWIIFIIDDLFYKQSEFLQKLLLNLHLIKLGKRKMFVVSFVQ